MYNFFELLMGLLTGMLGQCEMIVKYTFCLWFNIGTLKKKHRLIRKQNKVRGLICASGEGEVGTEEPSKSSYLEYTIWHNN